MLFAVDILTMGKNVVHAIFNPREFVRGEIAIFEELEQVYPPIFQTLMDNLILMLLIPLRIVLRFNRQMLRFFL